MENIWRCIFHLIRFWRLVLLDIMCITIDYSYKRWMRWSLKRKEESISVTLIWDGLVSEFFFTFGSSNWAEREKACCCLRISNHSYIKPHAWNLHVSVETILRHLKVTLNKNISHYHVITNFCFYLNALVYMMKLMIFIAGF